VIDRDVVADDVADRPPGEMDIVVRKHVAGALDVRPVAHLEGDVMDGRVRIAQENAPAPEKSENPPGPASPSKTPPAIPENPKVTAWGVLETAAKSDKTGDRASAMRVLSLLPKNERAKNLAEAGLGDDKPEVRSAAALALGEMQSRSSIPKLKEALSDKEITVMLAAAHALDLMHDNAAYEVYYEILTGERKTSKGLIAEQTATLKDPKKLAELGLQEGIGFIPFAGMGWKAFKTIKKGDSSPARAAAATVLSKDPDPRTTEALANAAGDKNWIIRAAALEALSRRGDPSVLNTVGLYLSDQEGEVKQAEAALEAPKAGGSPLLVAALNWGPAPPPPTQMTALELF